MAGLARRWYLLAIGILASIGLAAYVFANVSVSYTAQASMLLLPSRAATALAGNNPYLNLGGMGPALDVLTRRVDADVVRLPLEKRFPEATYVAYADSSTSGPIVVIETTGPTEEVLEVLDAVRGEAADSLAEMQSALDVPGDARITLVDVFVDQEATIDSSTRLQFTVAVGAGGSGLSILLTGFIDGLLLARRARRGRREGSAPEHSLADVAVSDVAVSGEAVAGGAVAGAVGIARAEADAGTAVGAATAAGTGEAPVRESPRTAGIPVPRTSPVSSRSRKRTR